MKTLFLQGVRAFRDRVEIPLGKLTLLVGENSTGKSTVLACTRIAWDIVHHAVVATPELNEEPFELGTYDSIAHRHDARTCVARFTIGARIRTSSLPQPTRVVEATFDSDEGNPTYRSWRCREGSLEIRADRREAGKTHVRVSDGDELVEADVDAPPGVPLPRAVWYAPEVSSPSMLWRRAVELMVASPRTDVLRPIAFAPIRSRPRRTYDPIHQRPDAEGRHVPSYLALLHQEHGELWNRVSNTLEAYGRACGLFDAISVRSLGTRGDPFQIEVDVPGQRGRRNLLDVGYGVSQVLPILVEAALAPAEATLLLQQPEVHLHPRAQAELGTMLATLVADPEGPQCLVETHSDYLVDRVAMAVRDPDHPLQPQDVSLLFFCPSGTGVTIHPLRFDARGNVVNPPAEYRSFFLHEHARFLGLDEADDA